MKNPRLLVRKHKAVRRFLAKPNLRKTSEDISFGGLACTTVTFLLLTLVPLNHTMDVDKQTGNREEIPRLRGTPKVQIWQGETR